MNVKVTVTVKSDSCLICGKRNKGLHFNVASCRACAAFFRRSLQSGKEYKCQRGTRDCNLKTKTKGTPLCRFCRLQKCRQFGMTIDKDTSMTPPPSMSGTSSDGKTVRIPKFSITSIDSSSSTPSNNHKALPNIEPYFSFRPIEEKIREILVPPNPIPIISGIRLTFLQQLEYGFKQFYNSIKPRGDGFTKLVEIDNECHKEFRQNFMVGLAQMLMHCKPFAELKFEDKILLYKHLKPIFNSIERFYSTIRFKRDNIKMPMLVYESSAVDLEAENVICLKNCDKEKFEKTFPLWVPFRDKLVNLLFMPMNDLKLTEYELIYLCGQILWSTQEINGVSANAHQMAEEITDQISSELHNYYIYEMRLVNYAPRLVKIIKLIDGAKAVNNALNDVTIISQVYNIYDFNADLTELVN